MAGESKIDPSCKLATKNFLIAESCNLVKLRGLDIMVIDRYLIRSGTDGLTGLIERVEQWARHWRTWSLYIALVLYEMLPLKQTL